MPRFSRCGREGNDNPLQYSCLENSVDGGAWWAAIYGVTQSWTWLKQLSIRACIGEGNGNPLQYSCLENPRDRGAWWAVVYGVAQSWTRLKWLSSSSSSSSCGSFCFLPGGTSCCVRNPTTFSPPCSERPRGEEPKSSLTDMNRVQRHVFPEEASQASP